MYILLLSNSLYKVKQSKLCNIVGSVRGNNYALISNKETGVANAVPLSIQNDEMVLIENSGNNYTEEPV